MHVPSVSVAKVEWLSVMDERLRTRVAVRLALAVVLIFEEAVVLSTLAAGAEMAVVVGLRAVAQFALHSIRIHMHAASALACRQYAP